MMKTNRDAVQKALTDLEDAITAEGFGCACVHDGTSCYTCRTREVLRKHVRQPFERLREALAAGDKIRPVR